MLFFVQTKTRRLLRFLFVCKCLTLICLFNCSGIVNKKISPFVVLVENHISDDIHQLCDLFYHNVCMSYYYNACHP